MCIPVGYGDCADLTVEARNLGFCSCVCRQFPCPSGGGGDPKPHETPVLEAPSASGRLCAGCGGGGGLGWRHFILK